MYVIVLNLKKQKNKKLQKIAFTMKKVLKHQVAFYYVQTTQMYLGIKGVPGAYV